MRVESRPASATPHDGPSRSAFRHDELARPALADYACPCTPVDFQACAPDSSVERGFGTPSGWTGRHQRPRNEVPLHPLLRLRPPRLPRMDAARLPSLRPRRLHAERHPLPRRAHDRRGRGIRAAPALPRRRGDHRAPAPRPPRPPQPRPPAPPTCSKPGTASSSSPATPTWKPSPSAKRCASCTRCAPTA